MYQPKINDKFRFNDGTIGTITDVKEIRMSPYIVVEHGKPGRYAFAIADLTLYQAPVTSNAIWQVKEE